jgi:hypothetical protein
MRAFFCGAYMDDRRLYQGMKVESASFVGVEVNNTHSANIIGQELLGRGIRQALLRKGNYTK